MPRLGIVASSVVRPNTLGWDPIGLPLFTLDSNGVPSGILWKDGLTHPVVFEWEPPNSPATYLNPTYSNRACRGRINAADTNVTLAFGWGTGAANTAIVTASGIAAFPGVTGAQVSWNSTNSTWLCSLPETFAIMQRTQSATPTGLSVPTALIPTSPVGTRFTFPVRRAWTDPAAIGITELTWIIFNRNNSQPNLLDPTGTKNATYAELDARVSGGSLTLEATNALGSSWKLI